MSTPIAVNGNITYSNGAIGGASMSIQNILASIAGSQYVRGSQSIPTSATGIKLGGIGTAGWVMIVNRDVTNFIQLLTATAGTVFAKLLPGEFALLRLDPTVTAPAAKADTASCEVEYLLIEN